MSGFRNSHAGVNVVGHTMIELMVAIAIGVLLLLAAFQTMAVFEGNKRTTTAINDAMQSGNFGMFEIDKLIRSAGTGVTQYSNLAGYGCALNYLASGSGTVTVSGGVVSSGALPGPFAGTAGIAGLPPLRLAPAVIFPGAAAAGVGSNSGSDVLMVMLGGAGYGESPVAISKIVGNSHILDSTVGFVANEWVLIGPLGLGQCLITQVAPAYAYNADNVVVPTNAVTIGSATAVANDVMVPLGLGAGQGANFMMYGVDPSSSSLVSLDLLNSTLASTSVQTVSDDIVAVRALYGHNLNGVGTLYWTYPVSGVTANSGTYDFSPAGLLAGDTNASTVLKSIKAIRVSMMVRVPLSEKAAASSQSSYLQFDNLFNSDSTQVPSTTWYVPTGSTYRYRVIETTIPVRNGLI
jgi:type IV pilus assembly protein PilW